MKPLDRLLQRWRISMALPQIRSGDRLLDIGCFDRSLIDAALDRIASAVGVDAAIEASSSAESVDSTDSASADSASANSARVELHRGCFPEDVSFDANTFDCITALAVLEHVEDPVGFAAACERLLAPGGRVVLTVPHPFVDRILDLLIAMRLVDGMAAEEHHGFDVAETRSIFESVGLPLRSERRFQLGLNRLYVFEKPTASAS